MDRHQVPLYLAAMAAGVGSGLALPTAGPLLGALVTPALILLLFVTFLGVPFTEMAHAARDLRFLAAVLASNFLLVPLVALAVTRALGDDRGLLLGALLVLLTPCTDYVIAFAGLAGGSRARLLAAAPLLMLLQMALLPLYLVLFAGPTALAGLGPRPFVEAFLLLIVAPLVAAVLVQLGARRRAGAAQVAEALEGAMVPLTVATLIVVLGSQVATVGARLPALLPLVPVYLAFTVLALGAGLVMARALRLDAASTRTVMLSSSTRNSLVVLPIALALPAHLGLAPLAVVTQTFVELLCLVVLVRLLPSLVPGPPDRVP